MSFRPNDRHQQTASSIGGDGLGLKRCGCRLKAERGGLPGCSVKAGKRKQRKGRAAGTGGPRAMLLLLDLYDLPAAVGSTGRADSVREPRSVALGAGAHRGAFDAVCRAALVASGLGGLFLRNGHVDPLVRKKFVCIDWFAELPANRRFVS